MNIAKSAQRSLLTLTIAIAATCGGAGCAADDEREDVGEIDESLRGARAPSSGLAAFKFDHGMLASGFVTLDLAETASVSGPTGSQKPGTTSTSASAEWYVVASVAATVVGAPAYHLAPLVKYTPTRTAGAGTFNTAVELMGNSSAPIERAAAYNTEKGARKFYRLRKGSGAAALSDVEWSSQLDGLVAKLTCASPSYPYHLLRIGNERSEEGKVSRWFVGYNPNPVTWSPGYRWDGNSNTFAAYVLRSAGYSEAAVPGNLWAPGFDQVARYSTNRQLQMVGTTGRISRKEQITTSSPFDYLAYTGIARDEYLQWNPLADGFPSSQLAAPAPVQFSPPMACASVLTSLAGGPSSVSCAKVQVSAALDPICRVP